MSNDLIPVQRVDKNGHTVTRWVKRLETGEPELSIPSPKSPELAKFAASVFDKIFIDFNESGYLVDIFHQDRYYTVEFSQHALEKLPPRVLRHLAENIPDADDDNDVGYLHKVLYDYIDDMYENSQDENIEQVYERSVTTVSNACLFNAPVNTVNKREYRGYRLAPLDYETIIGEGLYALENPDNPRYDSTYSDEVYISSVNYGALPKRGREKAQSYLVAFALTREHERKLIPSPELVTLIEKHPDSHDQIVKITHERGGIDVGLLEQMLNSSTPSLSSGVL